MHSWNALQSIATCLPTHVIAMQTSAARLNVGPACTNVVFHTDWFAVVVAKPNRTPIWDLDLPFIEVLAAFPISFSFLAFASASLGRVIRTDPCSIGS